MEMSKETEIETKPEENELAMRDSMVWYRSFFDAVENIKDNKTKYLCYYSIFNYGLNNELPQADNALVMAVFTLAKPLIDSSLKRYDACKKNGAKGGAPKGNQNAKKCNSKQPKTTKEQPKNNLNLNLNLNDNLNYNLYKEKNIKEKKTTTKTTTNQLSFSLSQLLKSFKEKYPAKTEQIKYIEQLNKIDATSINFDLLLEKIDSSAFLLSANNLGFEWCLFNYESIINGNYDDCKKVKGNNKAMEYLAQEYEKAMIKDKHTVSEAEAKVWG